MLSWAIGAAALETALLSARFGGLPLAAIASGWQGALLFLLALIATAFVGFFLAMFTFWPLIRVACGKYNGAPLKAGDFVLVLTGPHKGTTAQVREMTVGQGGWNLARLNLGEQDKIRCTDIFEQHSLLKIQKGDLETCAVWAHPHIVERLLARISGVPSNFLESLRVKPPVQGAEPDGAANGRQPARSKTNRTSSAVASVADPAREDDA